MPERLLVRTWNLFHGRTFPENRSVHLERMVRLATQDAPDVVCLQEVPVWALVRLGRWSGMQVRSQITKRALLGPLARPLQQLDPVRVRSPFTGQANALLVSGRLEVVEHGAQRLNTGLRAERRMCQLVRLRLGERGLVVANLHATNRSARARQELAEVERLLDGGGPAVVCGDFNVRATGLAGFSPPLPGIDQVLVRGLQLVDGPACWPDDRRRWQDGVLLSDHAPVEAAMMAP
jgi:endonuclease/exonuclease/phosphatase family metal-dependent hydrolase